MQDQYVGDVGDFGKYGLLRWLCGMTGADGRPALSLGVVWYRVPNEGGNDGKNLSYLDPLPKNLRRFGECDQPLYDALFDIVYDRSYPIVQRERRNVQAVQEAAIFPPGTAFYEDRLTFDGMRSIGPAASKARCAVRTHWFQKALEVREGRHLIFVDPDNGLEIPSTQRHHKRGPKYVFYEEIARFLERGQSVIVIHHAGRKKNQTVKKQIQNLVDRIRTQIRGAGSTFALRYHCGAPVRVFFVIPAKRDQDILLSRAEQLTQGVWSEHFSLVDPESI